MTLRLVALMSIVLLLSLGAFGLTMQAYQERVLEEVSRTASEVSVATLRSIEGADQLHSVAPALFEMDPESLPFATDEDRVMLIESFSTLQPGGVHAERVEKRRIQCGNGGDSAPACETLRALRERLGHDGAAGFPAGPNRVFFTTEALQVSGDPRQGTLVLRFPTFLAGSVDEGEVKLSFETEGPVGDEVEAPGTERKAVAHWFTRGEPTDGAGEGFDVQVQVEAAAGSAADPASETGGESASGQADLLVRRTGEAHRATGLDASEQAFMGVAPTATGTDSFTFSQGEDFELPVRVGDYGEIFDSLRRRSLLAFLGIFVVGTALSAGLASRFTRPIRRLDTGIRRISEGDLDVEVTAEGRDEIGRLAAAFNRMTGKLRDGRERQREMVRREKLSALGGLAAGVAHDVRNPLHSIGLTLEHLRDSARPETAERAAEFDRSVDIIQGEVQRLDRLVTDFLRFTRAERKPRQPVDLADLLSETARLIGKEAEWRRVDVQLDAPQTVPAISADGEAVRSAILNLVLNGFEAMGEDGGRLTLRLGVEGREVWVEVEDTGCGIPAEDQERVFEFAYTTRQRGSGLGLAIVHQQIVEEHGGRVTLNSEPGEGTCVRISLPIEPPERPEAADAGGRA